MRVWADVYSAAGNRLGGGPVALRDASVTRALDGVGSVRVSAPGTDARARALLANENHVRILVQAADDAPVREMGRGVIRQVRASGSPMGWTLTAEGPDDLDGLTRVSTKLARAYSAQTVSAIAGSLVGMVSGWSVTAGGGNVTDARFDGVSVLKALRALVEQQGLHLRAGTTAKTVEIGAFGASAGLRLANAARAHPDIEGADEMALIESIEVEQDSEAVCTRLFPLGAGIGEAWLTLAQATRNLPYTRQVVTVNGFDQFFLEDFGAVAQYGVIERTGKFSGIAPLSNSEADQEAAANALYDLAAAWLARYSRRLDAYHVTVRKARTTVRPGDKVRLVYNGVVTRDGEAVKYLDVDGEFWVMGCTERVGVEGAALDLSLASVDRHAQDGAQVVIGALEEMQIDSVTVKPYFNKTAFVYDRVIDAAHPAVAPLRFTNATQRLHRCLLRIKTRSFISTVLPEVTDNLHRHTWVQSASGDADGLYLRKVTYYDEASDAVHVGMIWIDIPDDPFLLQTAQETSDDEIALTYGLREDTLTPAGLTLRINGTDYTTALGGPWRPRGGAATIDLDITAQVIEKAGGTLAGEYLIEVRCASGQGEVEMSIEVYDVIQAIAVG